MAEIVLLLLFLALASYFLRGAVLILASALEQGFVGVVAMAAAWVFLFPLMAIWAVLWGILSHREEIVLGRGRRPVDLEKRPADPKERYKWANRLPPYDR